MYENILDTLKKEIILIEYKERILLLRWQITSLNQETMKICKFQQVYKKCYKIFKKKKSLLSSNFIK